MVVLHDGSGIAWGGVVVCTYISHNDLVDALGPWEGHLVLALPQQQQGPGRGFFQGTLEFGSVEPGSVRSKSRR